MAISTRRIVSSLIQSAFFLGDVVEGIAQAYDAVSLDPNPIDPQTPRLKLLWDSKRAGVTYNHAKFCAPLVADGRLFVPTYDGRVDMYMLG